MGRPSQLRDPKRAALLEAIRNGAPFCDACRAVGVSYATFKSWRRHGRIDRKAKKESAFAAFLSDTEKASAEFVTEGVAQIKAHASKNWTARAWLLERRRPEQFGDNRHMLKQIKEQQDRIEKQLAELAKSRPVGPSATDLAPPEPPA